MTAELYGGPFDGQVREVEILAPLILAINPMPPISTISVGELIEHHTATYVPTGQVNRRGCNVFTWEKP